MTRNRSRVRSFSAFMLLLSILVTSFCGIGASADDEKNTQYRTDLEDIEDILTATSYADYLEDYGDVAMGDKISIGLLQDLVEVKSKDAMTEDDEEKVWSTGTIKTDVTSLGDYSGDIILCGDDSTVSWTINVPSTARYNIYIEYYTGNIDYGTGLVSKATAAERYILIDGAVPYKEARSVEFGKIWADAYPILDENGNYIYDENNNKVTYLSNSADFKEFISNPENMTADSEDRSFATDYNGNELKPDKQLIEQWSGTFLYDSTGYYSEPLSFYLTEGEHVISLQAVREPLAIKAITLEAAPTVKTYEEYLASYPEVYYEGDPIKIQAEFPTLTSGDTIYALNDRSSGYSEPQDAALIRLNAIGGDKWQYVGQWVEWEVTVPQDGFYSIIPRSKQDFYSGIYVSRRIYINGELPFQEAGNLQFLYSTEWKTDPLNDGTTEFQFYLKEGVNKIRLEVVLGDMAEVLNTVELSLSKINEYYRKILMITGPDPDDYRDYGFDKLIPDVVAGLAEESKILYDVSNKLTELVGEKGEHSTTLDRVALTCERMGTMPSVIASEMSTLKDYTASLGTWLSDTQNQPLEIDYIVIQGKDAEPPQAEAGFFESLWYEIKKFFMSFFSDYNNLGAAAEGEDANSISVTAWTATSRDQAQILRTLVDDEFTPNYEGITVNIQLVAGGTLLPATLAGTGPDVYLGGAQGDPVNYAIRSAVLSLNTETGNTNVGYNFSDLKNSDWNKPETYESEQTYTAIHNLIENGTVKSFEEVTDWFVPQAMVPLTLYGETYGLPMTMSFSMMFYRKDIFVELGIEVPNTWDDFYDIIYTLQSNALDIGFPQGTGGSMIFMYQQGEALYDEGNYDYYLELFRRAYYDGDDYDSLSADELAAVNATVDAELLADELVYESTNADGTVSLIPKTDGMTINLDSDISLSTFKEVCEFFTMYDFPLAFDFANRFRSGEMPIAIQDYTAYNTLIVFAPEINGLWEFTPLPGEKDELTQEINNVTIGSVSAIMLMNTVVDKPDEVAFGSWAFMQWYLSADVQSAYGNEMVALLGPSAKQPTANKDALFDMAWSTEEFKNLESQFGAVVCTPEYPGSYIIARYTSFANLDVVNNDAEPVEELRSYIPDINVELARKRSEFGLPTSDSVKEMMDKVEEKYPNWDAKYDEGR